METGTDKTASGRSASLVSLLQGIDQRHRHPQNPARQVRGVPEQANRQIERAPLARLTPCKTNARTHSPKQVGRIAASIKRFGFIVPTWSTQKTRLLPATAGSKQRNCSGLLRCRCSV